jgi:uncharacterized protein YndB with AHSA1/START domain
MSDRIERELSVPADVQDVWDAITGDGWLADEVSLELTPGGEASFRSEAGEKRGWVEDVCEPDDSAGGAARLAFWWATGEEPASRVELTIEPEDYGHARVRVIETRPLDRLDLIGTPMRRLGGRSHGPALVAA